MEYLKALLLSDTFINIYTSICAAVVFFTPILIKTVMFNKQPQRLFGKPFYKRIHWSLGVVIIATFIGVWLQVIKDRRSQAGSNDQKKSLDNLKGAIERQGYYYDENTNRIIKLLGDKFKVVNVIKVRDKPGQPLIHTTGESPELNDTLFKTGHTSITMNFYNKGNGTARDIKFSTLIVRNLKNIKYVVDPRRTISCSTMLAGEGRFLLNMLDFSFDGNPITTKDTLYSITKVSYKNNMGIQMPIQYYYYGYFKALGLTFLSVDDYSARKLAEIAKTNNM